MFDLVLAATEELKFELRYSGIDGGKKQGKEKANETSRSHLCVCGDRRAILENEKHRPNTHAVHQGKSVSRVKILSETIVEVSRNRFANVLLTR